MSTALQRREPRDAAMDLAEELTRPRPVPAKSQAERVRELNRRYADVGTESFLRAVIEVEFPGRVAVVSSFGAEAAVLLSLVAKVNRATPIIFLDTGMHFAQTLSYRDKVVRLLGLTDVRSVTPDARDLDAQDPGATLWQKDTNRCCHIRKVLPLERALQGFDVWINGRKQIHGGARIRLPRIESNGRFIKVNPLARWSQEDIERGFAESRLPRHPMVEQRYTSIGCWPCTAPAENDDLRSGRWAGSDKTECGIHLPQPAM